MSSVRWAPRHFAGRQLRRRLSGMRNPAARLRAMATELRSDLADNVAIIGTDIDAKGEDTTPSQHPADVASDLYAREELVAGEVALERELDLVEDALERIAKEQYGLCIECGRRIAPDRLAALPHAARCIGCQRRAEGPRLR